MKRAFGLRLAGLVLGAAVTGGAVAAETTKAPTGSGTSRSAPAARPATGARGLLPDPVLLDGSTHTAEKKSEFGMIGDFELPGEENNRSGKVGGGSGQPQQDQGEGGGGMPQGRSGGGQKAAQVAKSGGGAETVEAAQQGGGGPDAKASDKAGGAAGDPNAKPEGIQVAQLGGDPSGTVGEQGGGKPSPVAIGDNAMRIPQQTPNIAVVGAQQVANQNTQVYEKATGSGGKAPTGVQGPNRTEKGRAIPAGL